MFLKNVICGFYIKAKPCKHVSKTLTEKPQKPQVSNEATPFRHTCS